MIKTFLYLFLSCNLLLCFGQSDTLFSKVRVNLAEADFWESISDQGILNTEFEYLEGLLFFEIEYLSDGNTVRGYVVEPAAAGRYPIIIFNRGGNRDFADLDLGTMLNYTSRLAAKGYVIIASNYRAQDEFGGREVNDVLQLIDLSASIEKADTARIGMFGWSRGGMMAYLSMACTDRLRTVVVANGPTDLKALLIDRSELEMNVYSQCIPDYWQQKETALFERSVINWPQDLDPSTSLLILAGTQDSLVKYQQAVNLAEKLKSTSISCELKLVDTDHFFSDKKEELHNELTIWFDRELKGKREPPKE